MSIWSNLRKARSADALASQRDNVAALIGSHEAELARLREQLRTGFTAPDFDPKAIGRQIADEESELAALRGAMEGVDAALAAAKAAEAEAASDALHVEAVEAQRELRDAQVAAHVALTRLASVLTKEREAGARLAGLNSKLAAAGRGTVDPPLTLLQMGDYAAWEQRRARDPSTPVNPPYLTNPLQGIDLIFYVGKQVGNGPDSSPLARLVELKI